MNDLDAAKAAGLADMGLTWIDGRWVLRDCLHVTECCCRTGAAKQTVAFDDRECADEAAPPSERLCWCGLALVLDTVSVGGAPALLYGCPEGHGSLPWPPLTATYGGAHGRVYVGQAAA